VRRALAIGAAAVAVYAAVAGLTAAWSGHRLRPLFEGISSPVPYQWVKPPAQFAANNIKAAGGTSDIVFASGKSKAGVAASVDQQFIADVSAGAFAVHGDDTKVHATVTPLDPASVAAPANGVHADGNVYRLVFAYEPSGAPVAKLAVPGDVVMSSPFPTAALLYSADGTSWQQIPSQQVGGVSTVGGTFDRPGYYVAGSKGTAAVTTAGGASGGSSGTIVIAVVVGLVAVALGAGGWWLAKRRRPPAKRRQPPAKRRPGPAARKPGATGGGRGGNAKGGRRRR
jgi:hypothetical protein